MSDRSHRGQDLKPRELEVLQHMSEGLTNREIAQRLHIGVETVRTYAKQIYAKLDVSGRVEASRKAWILGLLEDQKTDQGTLPQTKLKLPIQLTDFVGRQKELADLNTLLARSDVRLITILAPGGMGKTRLAIESASRQLGHYQDGIFFIALQSLEDAGNIVTTIADVLGFAFQADKLEPRQQLLNFLAHKQILLVMDNFEHLLNGIPLVEDILKAAPDVTILTTSREKLNLSAEYVFQLQGLRFPDWETPEDALEYDAVQLLINSAQRIKPDWVITQNNLDSIARICRLTSGMPLGIILAISWLDLLSLEKIAAEIQKNVDFLETEIRDIPDRQRSIRAVFNYTWQRLTPDEQDVFMKLSVFRGGFTHVAVQSIMSYDMRSLHRLVGKALITRTDVDRYTVHELLRQYGAELLSNSEESENIHDAHSQYFLDWLANLEPDIKGKRQQQALNEIARDFENIRGAWIWSIGTQQFSRLDQAGDSLFWYCEMQKRVVDGLELFNQLLDHLPDESDYEVIWSRFTIRKYRWSEHAISNEQLASAKSIVQQHVLLKDMAMCWEVYGEISWALEQKSQRALEYYEKAHQYYQTMGDKHAIADVTNRIGLCHGLLGDLQKGIQLTQQSVQIQRQIGDLHGLGIGLNHLGIWHIALDQYQRGLEFLLENIESGKQIKYPGNLAWAYGMASIVYTWGGELDEAYAFAQRATTLGQDIGFVQSQTLGLSALAFLTIIVDEDYTMGLQMSKEALKLASISNQTLAVFAQMGISLALCGLQQFEKAQIYINRTVDTLRTLKNIPVFGMLASYWCIYCYETNRYQDAVRFLGFVRYGDKVTFTWANHWQLLSQVQEQLQTKLDKATFDTLREEGRQMSLEQVIVKIVG